MELFLPVVDTALCVVFWGFTDACEYEEFCGVDFS
jgi:hypothetical protein